MLQKKHRRMLRKFLRGNHSSTLKSFKSQKPTSQVNMYIISFRLTNKIWQPIGSKILAESAFLFYTHQVKLCEKFSLLPSLHFDIIQSTVVMGDPVFSNIFGGLGARKAHTVRCNIFNCYIRQLTSSHSCQLTVCKTGCMQSYQEEGSCCERTIPRARCF